jgi:hypothetical protein
MADKRKLSQSVPEQGLEYTNATVFPRIPFLSIERVGAFSAHSGIL